MENTRARLRGHGPDAALGGRPVICDLIRVQADELKPFENAVISHTGRSPGGSEDCASGPVKIYEDGALRQAMG